MLSDIFVELKLYKPCCKCCGRRLREDCTALKMAAITDPQHLQGASWERWGEQKRCWCPALWRCHTGCKIPENWLLFSHFICSSQRKRLNSKGEMGPRSLGSRVCGSVVRCLLLSLPVGIGLGRKLWDICWLAHPSGNIYLFINLFYEDCTGYTVQFLTNKSLFRVYKPWLDGKCDTIVHLWLQELVVYSMLLGRHCKNKTQYHAFLEIVIPLFYLKIFKMYKQDFDIPIALD